MSSQANKRMNFHKSVFLDPSNELQSKKGAGNTSHFDSVHTIKTKTKKQSKDFDIHTSASDLGKIKQQIQNLGKTKVSGVKKIEIGINRKDPKKGVTLKQTQGLSSRSNQDIKRASVDPKTQSTKKMKLLNYGKVEPTKQMKSSNALKLTKSIDRESDNKKINTIKTHHSKNDSIKQMKERQRQEKEFKELQN